MRTAKITFGLVIIWLAWSASAAHVQFHFADFTTSATPLTNRVLLVQPTNSTPRANGNNIITSDRLSYTNDGSASVTISNMVVATYHCIIRGPFKDTAFQITVPDTNAVLNAKDLLSVNTNSPPGSVGYSMTSADSVFVKKLNSWSSGQTLTNAHFSGSTNFFTVPTNSVVQGSTFAAIDTNGNVFASIVTATGGGGGETNTSSNVGDGVGIAAPKSGVDLPFKSFKSANAVASFATNDTNITLTIDLSSTTNVFARTTELNGASNSLITTITSATNTLSGNGRSELNSASNSLMTQIENKVDELNGVATNINTFGLTNQGSINNAANFTNWGTLSAGNQSWSLSPNGVFFSDIFSGNTLLKANGSSQIASVANARGALTNNGSGGIGNHDRFFTATNDSATWLTGGGTPWTKLEPDGSGGVRFYDLDDARAVFTVNASGNLVVTGSITRITGNIDSIRGVNYNFPTVAAATDSLWTMNALGDVGFFPISAALGNFTNTTTYSSHATNVPAKISSIANPTTNQFEIRNSAGALLDYVGSNGTIHVPVGAVADVAYGNTNNLNTGLFFPPPGQVIDFAANGTALLRVQNNSIHGVQVGGGVPLSWGTLGSSDVHLFRENPGVLSLRGSTSPQTNNIFATYASATDGEKLEMGYNGTHSWFFIESQTNGAGTLRPLALGVTTNASIVVDVTRGVTVKAAQTNIGGLSLGPSGALITNVLTGSANLDFPSTSPATNSDLSITVTGTTTNDVATLQVPPVAWLPLTSYHAFCSNDTVWVRFIHNGTNGAAAINPGPVQVRVLVTRW